MRTSTRLQRYVERHRGDDGDTLVEILLALIVLGLSTVALMTAFSTTIAASAEHRSFATFDTVLRSASNEVISQIQGPSDLYKSCAALADYQTGGSNAVAFSLPAGYTAQITAISYWDGTQFQSNGANCVTGAPQLLTVSVTNASGTTYANTFAVQNPIFPTPTQVQTGPAYKLVFVTQPAGAKAGVNFTTQPIVWVEDSNGNLVTTDLSSVKLAITGGTGTSGASLSNTCSGVETSGVVKFSNCSIDKSGTGYTLTATDGALYPAVSTPFDVAAGAVGTVSASCSTVTASPTSVRANGTSTSTITVMLCDSNGNGVPNQTVVLSQGSGSSVISPSSATTNASGVATFTVKDSTPQSVTYTAKDTTYNVTITQTAKVIFFGAPTSSCSSVTASPTSLLANGIDATTITVQLCDTNGNPVTGVTVQLLQGSGSSVISPSTSTTDLTGTVQFTATDVTAQTVTYTPKDVSDSVTLSKTVNVTFNDTHKPTAGKSTATTDSPQVCVTYWHNGHYNYSYARITVTLKDSGSNPVSGKTVSLADNSTYSTIQGSPAVTNSSGQVTFTVYDTRQQSVLYTATDTTDNVVVNQTVQVQYYDCGGNN